MLQASVVVLENPTFFSLTLHVRGASYAGLLSCFAFPAGPKSWVSRVPFSTDASQLRVGQIVRGTIVLALVVSKTVVVFLKVKAGSVRRGTAPYQPEADRARRRDAMFVL